MHRVALERNEDVAIVRAEGELDAFAAPDLEGVLADAAARTAAVVDLASVTFLDSTVLGLVVRSVRQGTERGCRMRVVMPRGRARRIFEITTLDRVLPVSASAQDAVTELAAVSPGWEPAPGT